MNFVNKPLKKLLLMTAVLTVFLCSGCDSLKSNFGNVSATDNGIDSEVSSQQIISAENAVEIYVDETKLEDCFLLQSNWNGEEYQNENSLNQLMMVEYMSSDSVIPQAKNKAIVTFKFAGEENPESVKLTQQANTFMANTGIPYDIVELELSQNEDDDYYFQVSFSGYSMYYYTLDCEWSDGNTAQYAFALERAS